MYWYWRLLREALSFREFEAEQRTDYLILVPSLAKYLAAGVLVVILGTPRAVRLRSIAFGFHGWGRWDSPEAVICPRCLWAGMRRQCYHGYTEWEAMDECPRCGRDI